MKKFSIFLIAALALLFAGCASNCNTKPSGTTYAADELKAMVDSGEISGAITVFYRNGLQEVNCSGWANVEKRIPIAMDQSFMQCSQTKGFCGVTIAMLVEEGKISLDDPVSKYLPEFKNLKVISGKGKNKRLVPAQNTLTIRMVMNHTGGFPFEIPTKVKKGWCALSLRDTAREAAANPLQFEPGTGMRYSNTGIDIGAAIIEVVSGKPWDVFLKERVLDPLGMKDTTFQPTEEHLKNSISMYEITPGKKAKFKSFNRWMPLPHNGPTVHPSAGAGLWTTANDQLKFYKMLMNLGVGENGVRILNAETVKTLLASNTRPAKLGTYSLGLRADNKGNFGHGGAWGTNCTVNWKTRQLQMTVIQFNGTLRPFRARVSAAAKKFFDKTLDTSGVDTYTGRLK